MHCKRRGLSNVVITVSMYEIPYLDSAAVTSEAPISLAGSISLHLSLVCVTEREEEWESESV